jgi:hypothetical protein
MEGFKCSDMSFVSIILEINSKIIDLIRRTVNLKRDPSFFLFLIPEKIIIEKLNYNKAIIYLL